MQPGKLGLHQLFKNHVEIKLPKRKKIAKLFEGFAQGPENRDSQFMQFKILHYCAKV